MKLPHRTIALASVMVFLTAGGVVHHQKTASRQTEAPEMQADGGSDALVVVPNKTKKPGSEPGITPERAVALALNDLQPSEEDPGTLELRHPKHAAFFSREEGIRFSPRFSNLTWNWKLRHFGGETRNLLADAGAEPRPEKKHSNADFDHGAFIERYLPKKDTVEQRFILKEQPAIAEGENLVIRGQVTSGGAFDDARADDFGWVWRESHSGGVVSLGQVTVFDAAGEILPATMLASADTTQITVDGAALAGARYPVTVDPEIGTNDFLISEPTTQGDEDVHELPATAHGQGRICVAWLKGSPAPGATYQLYVQLVDTSDSTTSETGPQLTGDPVLITDKAAGTRPAVSFDGEHFMVAWNEARNNAFDTIGRAQVIDRRGNTVLAQPVAVTSSSPHQGNSLSLSAYSRLGQGFVLAWVDGRRMVRFRVVDTRGNVVHPDRVIGAHGSIASPAELALSSAYVAGSAHCITWMQSNVETGGRDVVARFVGSNGAIDVETAIVASGRNRLAALDVAVSDRQVPRELAFIWQDQDVPAASGQVIYHRLMNADLSGKTEAAVVSLPENNAQILNPEIAYAAENQAYVVTWAAHANGDLGIRGSLVAEQTGDLLVGGFALTDEGGDAAIVMASQSLRNDRLFVVVSLVGEPRANDIGRPMLGYTLELPNNSFEIKSDPPLVFGVAHRSQLEASTPSVAYLSWSNHYVVAWDQQGAGPEDSEIMIRWIPGDPEAENPNDATSVSRESAVPAVDRITGSRAPTIAPIPNSNDFLVVWEARTPANIPGPRKTEIYGRAWYGHGSDWTSAPFQVSDTGRTEEEIGGFAAADPDVVYNSEDHRYLVVWSANADAGAAVPGNAEIYARSIEATNLILSSVIRKLSNSAAGQLPAVDPAVAYNANDNEYLVVWSGSKGDPFTMALKEEEIIGQRLSATAKPIGFPEIRVSEMGPILDTRYGARTPDVAYNPVSNEYLIVWAGEHDFHTNTEIHAQYLRANGTRRDFRRQISEMGMTDDFAAAWVAMSPQVAYEAVDDSFRVVWTSGHVLTGMAIGETEVFTTEVRANRHGPGHDRISDLGPDGNRDFDANQAAIGTDGEGRYLVAFDGNDDGEPLTHDSSAIFGQYFERYSNEPDGEFQIPTDPGAGSGDPDKAGDGSGRDPGGDVSPVKIESDERGTWLVWEEEFGASYAIQASTDLQTWQTIAEHHVQGDGEGEASKRFFRILILPRVGG